MADKDSDDQNDELMALASMFDETMFKTHKDNDQLNHGILSAYIDLTIPYRVRSTSQSPDVEHEVHHLPPVVLSFTLPVDYPSASPPQYSLQCIWLTREQVEIARNLLDEMWNTSEGSVILFTWMNFIVNDLFIRLGIASPILVSADALTAVVDNDIMMREKVFAGTSFTCEVCYADKLGAACTRFDECGHVFCKNCVREFFELHITDGSVAMLKCLSHKCLSTALPSQVKSLVSAPLHERYDRILLQRSLDMMLDVVYCPRKTCMTPVLVDENESMGSCPLCQYVFCTSCKTVYHGVSPCKISAGRLVEMRREYLAASETGKQQLERRYGRDNLMRAVEEYCLVQNSGAEQKYSIETFIEVRSQYLVANEARRRELEMQYGPNFMRTVQEDCSETWVEDNCKKCPQCRTDIEKKDGCNKMVCTKCHAKFCWLCLTPLPQPDPYSHFQSAQSPCFDKLFVI